MLGRCFPGQFDNAPTNEPGNNTCITAEARQ
jgi:hypothetical protein